jgi:phosphohistidine phosphatase
MGRILALAGPEVQLILCSPLLRARRTAELISGALPTRPALRVSENLAPGFRAKSFLDEALAAGPDAHVLAVGHQPDMGHLIAYVIDVPAHGGIALSPGAAAKLVLGSGNPPAEAHLEWLMAPSLARALKP